MPRVATGSWSLRSSGLRRARPAAWGLLLALAVAVACALPAAIAWVCASTSEVHVGRPTRPTAERRARPRVAGHSLRRKREAAAHRTARLAEGEAQGAPAGAPKERPPLDLSVAALLAGFAFETYNTPEAARWERGEDGCDVAFLSEAFVPNVYAGVLSVTVYSARGLREEDSLGEALLTGGRSDPYLLLNVIEKGSEPLIIQDGPRKGDINKNRLQDSLDVVRTSTRWRGGGQDFVVWNDGEGETVNLYVKDPNEARLGIRVMDENVAKADELLGAVEVELGPKIGSSVTGLIGSMLTQQDPRVWNGSTPLYFKEEGLDWGLAAAGAAGTAMMGLATGGASVVAGAALMAAKALAPAGESGNLNLQLRYAPLTAKEPEGTLKNIVGATEGVDWGQLAREAGGVAAAVDSYEWLGFINHRETLTQAGLWRNSKTKSLIVAFRGTENVRNMVTDVQILKTPWLGGEGTTEKEGEVAVQEGNREALESVAQRLKALISSAVGGKPQGWEILLTGHSLGGALATLMALDLAGSLDASRSLPPKPDPGWFFGLFGAPEPPEPPRDRFFDRIRLYTFGSPRVGNAAFAAEMDAKVPEFFRIVNREDVVTRLPRGGYVHGGRSALLLNLTAGDKSPGACEVDGLWVEGMDESVLCPSGSDSKAVRNPLAAGALLGDIWEDLKGGPSDALKEAAERIAAGASELRARAATTSGAAADELSQLASSAASSAAELQAISEKAGEVSKKVQAAYKAGATPQEAAKIEAEATAAVEEQIRRALEKASTVGEQGEKLAGTARASAAADGSEQARGSSKTLAEAAAGLAAAETAAAGAAEALSRGWSQATQRLRSATFSDALSIVGIDSKFADDEMKLLSAFSGGEALLQHLEPAYHGSLKNVVAAAKKGSAGSS